MRDLAPLNLAHLPTPLHPLPRLSSELGIELLVKRDDLTGSHLTGNKIRKLEHLLAEARRHDATHVLTCGGLQSNHCRATALAAAQCGMKPVLLLRTPQGAPSDLPDPPTGNVLLARLAGAEVHTTSPDGYRHHRGAQLEALADGIRRAGGRPYIVPEGGSNARGALGYVQAAHELLAQCGAHPPDSVVVATGSGGTLAGLALGFEAALAPTRAIGVAVCDDGPTFRRIVDTIAIEAHDRFGLPVLPAERYEVVDGFVGRGYALTTPEELSFLRDVAREDGLVLDPVYTGKGLRGLVTLVRADRARLGERVVFVHTGGVFGLMAHGAELAPVL